MAIGETPSEPLIELMDHALGGGRLVIDEKEIAKIAGIAKIENQKDTTFTVVFRISVISENQW